MSIEKIIKELEAEGRRDFVFDDGEYIEENELEIGKQKIAHDFQLNQSIFTVFYEYFNLKDSNEEKNKLEYDNVKVEYIIDSGTNFSNFYLPVRVGNKYGVVLKYGAIDVIMHFEVYISHGEITYSLNIRTKQSIELDGDDFYKEILGLALKDSTIKGSYFTMPNETINWDIRTLEDMNYEDIFLPDDLMDDAKKYVQLYENKSLLSRYMLSGVPGTGKTELTRIIASVLNKQGVTIIKTDICPLIKDKFELAKTLAPSLIIFDDIDLSLGDRNKNNNTNLLGDFLSVLDGVDKIPDNVGIISSTNATHLIDLAAQRPGRFNKLLFFGSLTKENIVGIVKKALNNLNEKYGNIGEVDYERFTDPKLIQFFESKKLPGAHIYETIVGTKNDLDIDGDEGFTIDGLIEKLTKSNDILEKKLSEREIKSSLDGKQDNGFGFQR